MQDQAVWAIWGSTKKFEKVWEWVFNEENVLGSVKCDKVC